MMLWRLVISLISARSAPAGNVWIRATADSMSLILSLMSVPDSTSIRTEAMPGAATDLTAITSVSELTCSSILTTIDSSTSSGVAPGYGTETSIWLKGIVGQASRSSPVSDTRPAARMANTSRLAATPLDAM